ncbi:MAG: hypothetical protein KDK70_26360 [Myxococcales bacterium]|nr:hypothetical protein [Myxococcales bacterium]
MHHAPSHRRSHLALALALAAPLSCSKSDEAEAPKAEAPADAEAAKPEATKPEATKPEAAKPEAPGGLAQAIAEGVSAAEVGGRLDRGHALGHFVLPSPATLLTEIRTKAAPAEGAAMLDETALRGLAGMALGARSGLAQHISLDAPIGCVLVDDLATEVPVACIVGYTGGAEAAIADLGKDNRQADAEGHLAHYRVEGQDLYIDDLDGHVAITNHAAILDKAKPYLTANLIGRAASITDDIEVVAYPKAVLARYSREFDNLFSTLRSTPMPATGNPLVDAWGDYSRASMDRSLQYYRELDQFELGLGLEALGLVFRYAIYPTPGSSAQSDTQAVASGPMDASLAQQLPAQSWLVSGSTVDWKAAWSLESVTSMRDVLLEGYATAVGRDAAEVRTAVESFLDENASLYGDDMAVAFVHLPGTQGGVVVSRKLVAPARAGWKPWTEGFSPETVLGPEGIKKVTWSFQPDATTVDGVAVDRWTIEPGPELAAEIARSKEPVVAELERRFGGLRLVIDRVEVSDRVFFVMAPGSQEAYVRAAIEATKSGGVGSDPGLTALLSRNPGTSAIMAVNVAGGLSWAREVLPPEATASLPASLGKDLGDFYVSATYGASGQQRGEMVLSQAMIDGLRALAR